MPDKDIRRISSGGEYEQVAGYCRAVVAGGFVHVAGTVGPGETTLDQCKNALQIIETALKKAGSGFDKVVRVTYYLVDKAEFETCLPTLRDIFGQNPPAATMIECRLIDDVHRIEIEVTALA
ncbi:Rid family hydrolase [Pseudaestuariivita rosea]|uniref:Rid family hydrolase n=1 Tax=Pseudaestuariivita rosea TaxID=2763263 RepID=UPI001ABA2005